MVFAHNPPTLCHQLFISLWQIWSWFACTFSNSANVFCLPECSFCPACCSSLSETNGNDLWLKLSSHKSHVSQHEYGVLSVWAPHRSTVSKSHLEKKKKQVTFWGNLHLCLCVEGLIHVGDELKEVNGIPVDDKTPEEIIHILVNPISWYMSAQGMCRIPPSFQFQSHDENNSDFWAKTIILLMWKPCLWKSFLPS